MTKNELKFIQSLTKRRERNASGVFVVEGEKSIKELIGSGLSIRQVYVTNDSEFGGDVEVVSSDEMSKMSNLKTPTNELALVNIVQRELKYDGGLALVLDTVQDPGNLGTIIRIAAWYGVKQIFCSTDTVDCFSPKVVQATMGAIGAMEIYYTDLEKFLMQHDNVAVYGTFLENARSIYSLEKINDDAFLIMGNEGNGICQTVEKYVKERVFLPPSNSAVCVESLNVAIATAITLSEFRRPR